MAKTKLTGWQLWKKEFYAVPASGGKPFLFQTDYAWIKDGIVIEHRPSNPYGCLPFKTLYERENGFWQWDLRGEPVEFLKRYEGWKRAKHRMTDKQMEKGWLLL